MGKLHPIIWRSELQLSELWKYHARLVQPGPITFVEKFYLLVFGKVQMFKVKTNLYFIF